MQAIITKFIPCTNAKPNRIKASCDRGFGYFSARNNDSLGDATRLLVTPFASDSTMKIKPITAARDAPGVDRKRVVKFQVANMSFVSSNSKNP